MPRRKPTVRPETTDGASKFAGAVPPQAVTAKEGEPSAFDLFVERGLHAIYDNVLAEPIPDELLRLIEDDRRK